MKSKKVSSFTSLKTALWMVGIVFSAIGLIGHSIIHFVQKEDKTQVLVFFAIMFILSVYRFIANYKIYKSPEFQNLMKKSQQEWKEYKETRKAEKKIEALNSYESLSSEESKKSHNGIFWIFASIGLMIYTILGTIFKVQDYVAPIDSVKRRRGRRGSRRRRY